MASLPPDVRSKVVETVLKASVEGEALLLVMEGPRGVAWGRALTLAERAGWSAELCEYVTTPSCSKHRKRSAAFSSFLRPRTMTVHPVAMPRKRWLVRTVMSLIAPILKGRFAQQVGPFEDTPLWQVDLLTGRFHVQAPDGPESAEGSVDHVLVAVHCGLAQESGDPGLADFSSDPRSEAHPRFNQHVVVDEDAALENPTQIDVREETPQ